MRRLAQAPNLAIATLWVHALHEEGIAATVQREYLGAAAGQLPPDQCLPEIWVDDDQQFERARRLLEALQQRPQRRWHCRRCGELVEGGFEQCWNCGAMMPGA
jgi:rubrerythrin